MYFVSLHPNTDPKQFEFHAMYKYNYQVTPFNSLEALSKQLCKHVWSHSLFMSGTKSTENFLSTQVIVLDYDQGYPIELAKEDFKDLQFILGATKSHRISKQGRVCDRYRIVLFFQSPITDAVQAKQNFYVFVSEYNKRIKQRLHNRIESYCQATHQSFKNWQAVDIASSSISFKWIPFKEVLHINQGKLLEVKPKISVEFKESSEIVKDKKFKHFNSLSIPMDGRSVTVQCPACLAEGGDIKGQNMSVQYKLGQYFYKCHKNHSHKI